MTLTLSDGNVLEVDHVVFASGYKPDLARVPYLAGVLDQVSVTDGFPDLSAGFETSLPGPVRHRLPGDPRLRAVLRVHQGLPVGGEDRGRRDAPLVGTSGQRRGTSGGRARTAVRRA